MKTLFCTPTYKEHIREIQDQIVREDGVTTLYTAVEQALRNFYGSSKD